MVEGKGRYQATGQGGKGRGKHRMESLWKERTRETLKAKVGLGGGKLSCELLVVYWWQNCLPEFDRWRQYCAEELGGRGGKVTSWNSAARGKGSKRVSQN